MEGFLEPKDVLNKLTLSKNMIAADFGSGSGGWVLSLAKKLEDGKVYAIDILEEPLSALKAKANLDKIVNIETIKSNIEKTSKLLTNTCDLILITNLLFEVEDKKFVLEEAKRVLKPEGEILVVDWKKDVLLGPRGREVPVEEIKKIAKELDLKLEKEFDASLYHWALLFKK